MVDHLTEINKAIESENMKHHKEVSVVFQKNKYYKVHTHSQKSSYKKTFLLLLQDETRRVLLVERERLKTKQKELDLRNK